MAEPSSRSTGREEGHLNFRPDIEGLRAVAIIAVVLYHARLPGAGGGFFGVDVFFVLSGFLISGIIVDEIARTGTLSLVNFWARRARRLLPAATFVTLVVLVVNASVLSLFLQIYLANTARAFAVYGSNIIFAVRSTDYFGGVVTHDPLLHTWSLSVEEQFYLFFAPAMLVLAVWTRKHGNQIFRRWITWLAVVLSSLSLVGCLLLARRYPVIAFYGLPARAWEFGLGVLALLAIRHISRIGARALEVIAVVSLVALVASVVLLHEGRIGIESVVPTLATVGLILSGAGARPTLVARGLSTSGMRLLGRLSYSWYLWHWPALVYMRATMHAPTRTTAVAVALLSLLPAAAMYAWIESPIRYSRYLKRHPRATVVGAIVLAALTYGAASLAIARANAKLHSPRIAKILAATANPRIYDDGCQLQLLKVESPACEYGPAKNDTTIVLFGDSHAAHWFPAFDSVATLRGWKYVNWTKTKCPAAMVHVQAQGRLYFECEEWKRKIIDRMVKLRPTIIVIAEDKTYRIAMGKQQVLVDSSEAGRREWLKALTETLRALEPSGAKLVLLGDTPQPQSDIPQCLVRHLDDPSSCDASVATSLNPALTAMEREATTLVPGVAYINLNQYLCDERVCPASSPNGMVRYQDSNHLSVVFAASLAPQLSQALTEALHGAAPK
jgi:peptidoglycan/LPS O-acetylase OafA/YrhL